MYWTMLRRELAGRKRQTIIVAAGLGIAIALVIVVSALSTGVRDAQNRALESVYGVGTDLTVTGAAQTPGQGGQGGRRFEFGQGTGTQAEDGTTTVNQSRLIAQPGRGTLDAAAVGTVAKLDGVASATGVLSLSNMTFSGQMPSFAPGQGQPEGSQRQGGARGGADGRGGSAFDIDSFTVLGVDPAATSVGPLSSVSIAQGRALTIADQGQLVAVVDQSYATSKGLALGGTLNVGGSEVQIVGIAVSSTDTADTAANVFLPLDTARALSGSEAVVSTVYVSASSSSMIGAVQAEIKAALPDATVSSQADLAASVSGSLSSASSMVAGLGTWLSLIVLGVALLIAMLLTSSGVSRRTREFGTLKALGWSNGRVVSQVAGESMMQALIGGVVGLALGLGAIGVINVVSPAVQAGGGPGVAQAPGGGGFGQGGTGPGGGRLSQFLGASEEIVLHAPVTLWIVVAAIGLAILGGVVAGAFGGWRAARLSPVEALRAVA